MGRQHLAAYLSGCVHLLKGPAMRVTRLPVPVPVLMTSSVLLSLLRLRRSILEGESMEAAAPAAVDSAVLMQVLVLIGAGGSVVWLGKQRGLVWQCIHALWLSSYICMHRCHFADGRCCSAHMLETMA
jgi:hypothetical protein